MTKEIKLNRKMLKPERWNANLKEHNFNIKKGGMRRAVGYRVQVASGEDEHITMPCCSVL
jgi:hypothetical protein